MLRAKDFRKQAWDSFSGIWGTMVLINLVLSLISGIGAIASLLITGPLSLGMAQIYMSVIRRNRKPEVGQIFDGFSNFTNAFILYIINSVLVMLWSWLFVIPGIIKSYAYSMSYYILADNPAMAPNDARKKSMEMMKGNKWRLFCLDFSFIGWDILCVLTCGILSLWITPYKNAAYAAFYQNLLVEQGLIAPEAPETDGYADTAATDI